jgi:catechol 2,3-dioxygenase-like lactoylglutathione lyase family enzyme
MSRTPPPAVAGLDHLVLTVASLEATIRFYEDVLGMAARRFEGSDGAPRWALAFGAQKINLHEAGAEFAPHAARPTPGSADLCFLTDRPLEAWLERLAELGVALREGPVARTGAQGPITSIYIDDPDGNLIEIARPAPA